MQNINTQFVLNVSLQGDNCKHEYDRALEKKKDKILCIVMEKEYLNQKDWISTALKPLRE